MTNTLIKISDYKDSYAHLNGNRNTRISKTDIARGIISIGKTHWTQYVTSPKRTIIDFIHYWTGLERFIIENPHLTITQDYVNLDLSDKVLKSYQIGMGISKIIAERVLKIPYLQHVDSLVKSGVVTLTTGTNERGDLVGLDKNKEWHVMEAKGRTNEPSKADRTKAKTQAEKIATISGAPPKTKSYCITYINDYSNEISLTDPDEIPPNSVNLVVSANDFIKTYYDKLFKDFYDIRPYATFSFADRDIDFSIFQLDQEKTKFYLGLENRILQSLRQGNIDFTETLLTQNELFDSFANLNVDVLSIGNDGILLLQDVDNILLNKRQPSTDDGLSELRITLTY